MDRVDVRKMEPGDFDSVSRLLVREFPRGVPPGQWRRLFEYSWVKDNPNSGFVLVADGRIVGFLGVIYSIRQIREKVEEVCNMTSWCVEDKFRRYALLLFAHFLKHTTCTITNFSATKFVVEILRRSGFEELDTGKIVLPPFLNISTWFSRMPVILIRDIDEITRELNTEHLRILRDHISYECVHLVVKEPGEYCYIVAKRRKKRGIPFVDVLYCSNLTILERHLERIKIVLLVRMKALALLIDTRLFSRTDLQMAWRISRPSLYRSDSLGASDIDALYSELVLLSI